jgi:hypothetical protein
MVVLSVQHDTGSPHGVDRGVGVTAVVSGPRVPGRAAAGGQPPGLTPSPAPLGGRRARGVTGGVPGCNTVGAGWAVCGPPP